MTIQEAAGEILIENRHPLDLMELAGMVQKKYKNISNARDPLDSIKKTIHSNIMRGKTRGPELIYIDTPEGKKISLPEWQQTNR